MLILTNYQLQRFRFKKLLNALFSDLKTNKMILSQYHFI